MNYTDLISTTDLVNNLHNDNLVIVDCRFDLTNPEQGFKDYLSAHVPGSFYANLDKDLASPVTSQSGRHPLPDKDAFSKMLAGWGVNDQSQIVAYDQVGGSMAVRLWWLLRYFGFNRVAILDGGIKQWVSENRPMDDILPKLRVNASLPSLTPNPNMLVTTQEMTKLLNSPDFLIIDARSPERYMGQSETIDKIAGHIPGAINRFHGLNLNYLGLMKSSEKLRQEYLSLIDHHAYNKVVVYCGSGVTSCHLILAMKIAGIDGPRLYLGSWSEWIRDPGRPVITI